MIPHSELKIGDPIWIATGFAEASRASVVDKDEATGLCWISRHPSEAFIPAPRLMFRTKSEAEAGNEAWLMTWRDIALGFAQLTSDEIETTPDDAEHADARADLKNTLAYHRATADAIVRWLTPYTTPDDQANRSVPKKT